MKTTLLQLKTALLLVLLTVSGEIFSQLSDWVNYTHGDMLAEMYNDGDYLWIATDGGLVKLNKTTEEKTFYTHANTHGGMPENHLRTLTKDNAGNMWVGTQYDGIGKFNDTEGVSYFSGTQGCYSIKIDSKNNIWFPGNHNLYKFDGNNLQSWTFNGSSLASSFFFLDLEFDRDSVLWLGGRFADDTGYPVHFARFTENEGLSAIHNIGIGITETENIEVDNDNNIWLAGNGGLVKYRKEEGYTVFNKENSSLPSNYVHDIKIDAAGIIWLVAGNYLVRFDGEQFVSYEIPYTDSYKFIYSMEIDLDGTVWLGSRLSGLIKFKDGIFKQIDVSNSPLLTNEVAFDLEVDSEGNVWLGTRHNLVRIDPDDNWSSYYEDINYNYFQGSRVTSANVSPTGDLWIAFGRGDTCILKVSDNGNRVFTGDNTNNSKFFFDKKGNTWIASQSGLYKHDGAVLQHFSPENTPLTTSYVNALAFDKDDNLWGTAGMALENNGCVFKYDGANWTIYTEEADGLPSSTPHGLKFDSKGNLWLHFRYDGGVIGWEYGHGLTKFDGISWTSYNVDNSGIPSNTILDIEIDKDDNIWLATTHGLTKFDGTNWEVYNTSNSGLASDWTSGIALDYHRDKIWITHLMYGGLSVANLNSGGVGIEAIKENLPQKRFDIYPNPAKTTVNIRLNRDIDVQSLEISDVSGQLLCRRNLSGNTQTVLQLPLSVLNIDRSGLYLVKLTGKTGSYTQRLLVAD
jgi:ligand-binding sensor domain-containing protein